MRSGLQIFSSLSAVLLIGAVIVGCGDDDDSDSNANSGYDASVADSGSGGRASTAGRGGSRATAGRSGSGAVAGRGAATAGRGAAGASGAQGSSAGTTGTRAGTGGSTAGGDGGATGGTTGAAGSAAGAGAGGAGANSALLTDAQIAAVTTAANTGEIALGNLALSRARLPAVRDFAQEMITMHGAAQSRSLALLQALMITPVASNLSTSLEQDAQRTSATLEGTSAAGFDLAYIESQVQIHMQVLTTFDEILLPSVTSPALRTDLTLARADVQSHLAQAQALLVVVQNAPPIEDDAGVAEDAGL